MWLVYWVVKVWDLFTFCIQGGFLNMDTIFMEQ